MKSESKVGAFYAGCGILVTGATGFLGRLLLEKLLRSCPDLDKIYVIIRKKKGKDVTERMQSILEGPVFQLLKKEQPNVQDKLHLITGDFSYEKLGLDSGDQELLINNVDVVFHCAATIRFTEPLRHAVNINVRGTRELLAMCERMPRLKCFMHVSTAFSFCPRGVIEEVHYDPPMYPETIIRLVNESDEDTINRITPQLLRHGFMEWPNTYSLTKAIAEQLIAEKKDVLPVAILRPSIVLHTLREPIPSWTDNIATPMGYTLLAMLGYTHVQFGKMNFRPNIIPADYCINALIATAEQVAREFQLNKSLRKTVYNNVAEYENSANEQQYRDWSIKDYELYPPNKAVYHLSLFWTSSSFMYYVAMILFNMIPALLIDFVCLFMGQKPKLFKKSLLVHKFALVLKPFALKEWTIRNNNVRNVWTNLNETDKELFPFNMDGFNWEIYFRQIAYTFKKYMLKEDIEGEGLHLAQKKNKR